jgi:hypothetical protein
MARKICANCGLPFNGVTGQRYCHKTKGCFPKEKKTFNHCVECGRKLGGGKWDVVPEKERLCSFCIERHQKEREKAKENKRNTMTKCKICGEYCFCQKGRICLACFKKMENPNIKEVKEVRTDVY